MDEKELVSALVVTYNHEHEVGSCVDAALAQELGDAELELVVVDNASTDATLAALDAYRDRITVVPQEVNRGYAAGVNAAFAASRGDWVLLLNPDAVMDPGCLRALLGHLRATPGAGAAAAWLRDEGGTPQRFARREIDLRAVAWTFTASGRALDARRGGRHQKRRVYEDEWSRPVSAPFPVDCPAAACVLVRRALLEPRPMDPALPLFFNDAELWRRLRAAGWQLDVVPAAGAAHAGATSVSRTDRVRIRAEWVASTRRYLAPALGPAGRGALWTLFFLDAAVCGVRSAVRRGDDEAALTFRATLGGLGLPGGPPPWLTPVRRRGRR